MLRTDTGSFNKLLTSVGLALVAFAFLLPYFFFRNTDTLEIPAKDLSGMTSVGRTTIEDRQQAISDIEPWVIGGSIASGVIGIGLVIAGARRLKETQTWEDRAAQARTKMAEAQFEDMSPEEVEAKRDEEAASALDRIDQRVDTWAATATADAPTPQSPGTDGVRTTPAGPNTIRALRAEVTRVETKVLSVLNETRMKTHSFSAETRVSSQRSWPLLLDGLYKAQVPGYADIVVEIKLARQSSTLVKNARNMSDQLLALTTRYQQVTGRRAVGWLIVVIAMGEASDDTTKAQESRARTRLDELSEPISLATVVHEEKLDELSRNVSDAVTLSGRLA